MNAVFVLVAVLGGLGAGAFVLLWATFWQWLGDARGPWWWEA